MPDLPRQCKWGATICTWIEAAQHTIKAMLSLKSCRCFQHFCWDGSLNTTHVSTPYEPPIKVDAMATSGALRERYASLVVTAYLAVMVLFMTLWVMALLGRCLRLLFHIVARYIPKYNANDWRRRLFIATHILFFHACILAVFCKYEGFARTFRDHRSPDLIATNRI